VALKRQEELIREEELFGSSSDLRGKHGGDKKEKHSSKKKQVFSLHFVCNGSIYTGS